MSSITLPDNGNVLILGMTLQTANLLPTGSDVQIAAGALLDLNGTNQSLASLAGDSGSAIVLGGATLTVGAGGTSTTFAGTIYGSGGLTKTGSGMLTLSGADTHSGTTTVADGTLQAGAVDALSASSTYIVDSGATLDLAGFDQTIGSLSGGGEVTNTSATPATLSVGGDNTNTMFSGTIEDGGSQLSLDKTGSGTLTFTGPNNYTGPTVITAGILEVNNNVNTSPVTIDTGATLQGNGGTGPVTNLGGTYDATLYKVTIGDSALQDATGNAPGDVTLGYASGQTELVLAQSAADAVQRVLQVSNSSDRFAYVPSYSLDSYAGQAFVDLASGGSGGGGSTGGGLTLNRSYGGDYFPITVVQDNSDPIANSDGYQGGVGGVLTVTGSGVLANDTDQTSGASLSIYSHTNPANGTLSLNSNGSFTYTPNTGFFGTDTFSYIATDGANQSNSATVTIKVVVPTIDLLDDANNDGAINSADEPAKNTAPGKIILVTGASDHPTANADGTNFAEVQLNFGANIPSPSQPINLTGWTLTLTAVNGGSAVHIFDPDEFGELADNGVGSQQWALGTNVANSGVPSDVLVGATSAGTYTLQLTLANPAGATVATDQIKITAQGGMLIADTVDETSGEIESSRTLPHGQGAIIPLDNIDQWYNDTKSTFFNTVQPSPYDSQGYYSDIDLPPSAASGQTGGPSDVPDDEYLLPVVVKGAPGDTYSLEIPNNLRVWASDDRTDQITGGEAFHVDADGTTTVYVQGIADGTGTLQLDWTHAGVTTRHVDTLAVTVFEFQGPANVPNFSTYDYNAIGVPTTALDGELRWSLPNDSSGAEIANSLSNGNGVTIQWGYGGLDQRWANFTVNQYYTWDYNVNVVQITIAPPVQSGGTWKNGAIGVQQGTTQLPVAGHGANPNVGTILVGGKLAQGVVIASAPDGSHAITSGAGITMTGPEGDWGVDRMLVGITQVVTSINYTATYSSGTVLSATLNSVPPAYDAPGPADWYPESLAGFGAVTKPSSYTGLRTIAAVDAPQVAIPLYVDKALNPVAGDATLQSASLSINFQLYISAGIYDGTPGDTVPVGNAYTELAMAPPIAGSTNSWGWTTSGTFNGAFQYIPNPSPATKLQGPANSQWDQRVRGTIQTSSYLPIGNAPKKNDWK